MIGTCTINLYALVSEIIIKLPWVFKSSETSIFYLSVNTVAITFIKHTTSRNLNNPALTFRSLMRYAPLITVGFLALVVLLFTGYHIITYNSGEVRYSEGHRSVTAFQLSKHFNSVLEASYRYDLKDDSMPLSEFVARAEELRIEIAMLDTATYRNAIFTNELGNDYRALRAVATQIDVFLSGAVQTFPENFSKTLEGLRPSVDAIAMAVHDENDRVSRVMQADLKRDALSILLLCFLFIVSVVYLVFVEAKRRRHLLAKTRALEISETKLRDLSFYRQQFLANMSHEFRTPLNAIKGFSEAILVQKDFIKTERVFEYVDIVARSAKDLSKLTEDVLDLSKIDAGKFDIHREEVEFSRLIEDSLIQFRSVSEQRGIHISSSIEADWTVHCDHLGVKRCITNVLSNALKFSEKGGTIYVDAYVRAGQALVVEIRDVGCGIPERDLQSIWMVYARSSLTRKSDREGAGLGLAMVKALMDAHRGFVELQSREGVGTSVRLCFPLSMIINPRQKNQAADEPSEEEVSRIAS